MAVVQEILERDETAAAMEHDGVRPETLLILEEATEGLAPKVAAEIKNTRVIEAPV